MGIERYLFFWAGGIFVTSVDAAVTRALESVGAGCPGLTLDPSYKRIKEDVLLGRSGAKEFYENISALCPAGAKSIDLEEEITGNLVVDQGASGCLTAVKEGLRLWLIADLPKPWFWGIPAIDTLTSRFPADHILFPQDCGLNNMIPDIFELILRTSRGEKDECLVLDPDLKRAVASINWRLPATVIIDPSRLEREFLLRRLIDREYRVHSRPI